MFFFFSFYRNDSLKSFGFLLNQLQISIIILYFFIFSKKELKVIGIVIYGSGTDYFLSCKFFYFIFFFFYIARQSYIFLLFFCITRQSYVFFLFLQSSESQQDKVVICPFKFSFFKKNKKWLIKKIFFFKIIVLIYRIHILELEYNILHRIHILELLYYMF